MADAVTKTECSVCGKGTNTSICGGCLQYFCHSDLTKHLQSFREEFDKIENNHDQLQQKFIDQKTDSQSRILLEQIDEWENDCVLKIKQTANKCRYKILNYIYRYFNEMENKLNDLAKQLTEIRQKDDFNEIELNHFKEKITKLEEELGQSPDLAIKEESTSFIDKISVIAPSANYGKWEQVGLTIAGGNGDGNQLNQLSSPQGIFIDDDQTIYIADYSNHRIVKWKSNATNGQIMVSGNGRGDQINQLRSPKDVIIDKKDNFLIISDWINKQVIRWSRENHTNGQIIISNIDCIGLAMDKNGSLYISDCEKNEVRQWKRGDQNGRIVAGGNGNGDNLNQLNFPTYIFVDEDYSLYIADSGNHRVMKWIKDAKEGIVVAGGNGKGNSLIQLSDPHGVIVDQLDQIYVADSDNNRVVRWCEGAKEGTIVVGGNGKGEESNQLNQPIGLSFDREGNLYVVDGANHRIQKFEIVQE